MRRLIFVLPLAAFAAIAVWFAVGLTRDPNVLPSALIDRPMPDFALPALAGADVPALTAAGVRGRVSLVNVFASWCVPCRAEHPLLMRLAREGRVAVYGIAYKDRAADAAGFLRSLGNPFAAIGHDESGRVAIDWGVYGVPETFIVGTDGVILYKFIGPISDDALQRIVGPEIEAALKH